MSRVVAQNQAPDQPVSPSQSAPHQRAVVENLPVPVRKSLARIQLIEQAHLAIIRHIRSTGCRKIDLHFCNLTDRDLHVSRLELLLVRSQTRSTPIRIPPPQKTSSHHPFCHRLRERTCSYPASPTDGA